MSDHLHVTRIHGVITLEDGSQHPFWITDINADTGGREDHVTVAPAGDTARRQLVADTAATIRHVVNQRRLHGFNGPIGPHLAREARCDIQPGPGPVGGSTVTHSSRDFDCCADTGGDVHHVNHSAPAGPLRPVTAAGHTPDAS